MVTTLDNLRYLRQEITDKLREARLELKELDSELEAIQRRKLRAEGVKDGYEKSIACVDDLIGHLEKIDAQEAKNELDKADQQEITKAFELLGEQWQSLLAEQAKDPGNFPLEAAYLLGHPTAEALVIILVRRIEAEKEYGWTMTLTHFEDAILSDDCFRRVFPSNRVHRREAIGSALLLLIERGLFSAKDSGQCWGIKWLEGKK